MAKDTIEAEFDLPPNLAKKYGKPVIVFDIPADTPLDKREAVATKMYDDWAMNEAAYIPPETVPKIQKIGVLPAMWEGAKKAGSDIVAGAKQLAYSAQKENPLTTEEYAKINAPLDKKITDLAKEQKELTRKYEEVRSQRPIAAPTGEVLPYVLTGSPWVVAATEALKYGDPGERAVRGILGGVSTGIGNVVGKGAAKYFNPELAPTTIRTMKNVQPMGVHPRLSELTGSTTLAGIEDVVMQAPFGGALSDAQKVNQVAYNRAAAKTIGMEADNLGEDVLAEAGRKIGEVYDVVKVLPVDVAPIRFSQNVEAAADKIIYEAARAERMHTPGVVDKQLVDTATAWRDMFVDGDFLTGADYLIARENLSNLAWQAEGSAKGFYRDLLNALDDSAEQSLAAVGQQELAAQLKIARSRYANLLTLEKGNVVVDGNVNINLLRNAVKQRKERAYKEGRKTDDLTKLAKYSEATSALRTGSPTAPRGFYHSLITAPYAGTLLAAPNAILANILASPVTKFIPAHLAGTKTGALLGMGLSRGAKIPSIEAEQDLIMRRLYGPFQEPQGALTSVQNTK